MSDTLTRLANILRPTDPASVTATAKLHTFGLAGPLSAEAVPRQIERTFGIEFAPGTILSPDLTVGHLVEIIDELQDE